MSSCDPPTLVPHVLDARQQPDTHRTITLARRRAHGSHPRLRLRHLAQVDWRKMSTILRGKRVEFTAIDGADAANKVATRHSLAACNRHVTGM